MHDSVATVAADAAPADDGETVPGVEAQLAAAGGDPWCLFDRWMAEARETEVNDPNAMALATVDQDGMPNVRMVLLKGCDERGFVFYSNTLSRKGTELLGARKASGVLHWKSLRRQVRFRGTVTFVADEEADAYFQSRSRQSRIGAWASSQSRPLGGRQVLAEAVAAQTARFAGSAVSRPPQWCGFRVAPVAMEFWMDQPFRLHDRLELTRATPDDGWRAETLFP